jgi:ribosomal protein L21E
LEERNERFSLLFIFPAGQTKGFCPSQAFGNVKNKKNRVSKNFGEAKKKVFVSPKILEKQKKSFSCLQKFWRSKKKSFRISKNFGEAKKKVFMSPKILEKQKKSFPGLRKFWRSQQISAITS